MPMKPWSKLQKRLYGIIDPRIDFQIHCVAYPMKSRRGTAGIPRYYITLGKEIIWDYPKDFIAGTQSGSESNYPHENDATAISLLIEEYIETDKTILLQKDFISDRWGLTDILKASDRRIGRKRLQSLLTSVRGTRAKEIIHQRNELYEGMKDSSFPEYFAR
ncbi:MAG: hypothetical protein KBA61_06590 [Spirochaetes bacterium]|nr:hypothetical protein [Spirochaetota bacterium]